MAKTNLSFSIESAPKCVIRDVHLEQITAIIQKIQDTSESGGSTPDNIEAWQHFNEAIKEVVQKAFESGIEHEQYNIEFYRKSK